MVDEILSNLIGSIYEASLEPRLWPDVMRQVTLVAPSVVATIYSHDLIARAPTFHQSYGADPQYQQDYVERWAASNPLIDAIALIEPGQVSGLASIIDYDAFKHHPFYLEWGKPQHYCDAINVMLERTPTRFSSVSLITSDEQGLADAGTIERLQILAPHFLRAIRIGRVLEHASLKEEAITETLNALAAAVLLLSPGGDLVHANTSASELMARGLTLGQVKAAARPLDTGDGRRERVRQEPADDRAFMVEIGGERFVGHALPLAFRTAGALGSPPLTLIVVRTATATAGAARTAAALFGLTGREREVLFGLVEVGGVSPVAGMLGLSKGTVKGHVKSLFSKTQTHRQSDLVKLVSGLMTPFLGSR